jgi:hypothetical protein
LVVVVVVDDGIRARFGRMNQDRKARIVASEMSPKPFIAKAHTKHRGPLPKVVAIKGGIREQDRGGRTRCSHDGRLLSLSVVFFTQRE